MASWGSVQCGQLIVDLNGEKVAVKKLRRTESGKVIFKGRVLMELTPAPVTQQPPQTYRGEDDPPPLSPQVPQDPPSPSSQQASTPGVKNVSKGQSCSSLTFDFAVEEDETEGKRKTRSSLNGGGSGGQAVAKPLNVEQTVGVGGEGSEVVDPPPETVGGDSSRASTQGDNGETRLRNSQVKRTKEKVKVSTKKRPGFRSDNMKQMRKALSSIINFHKRENTTRDPPLEGNKCGATKIFKKKAKEQTVKGKKCLKCSVCRKTFRYPSSLSGHFIAHRLERPFPCARCGAAFKRASHLKRHQTTHVDLKKTSMTTRQDNRKASSRNDEGLGSQSVVKVKPVNEEQTDGVVGGGSEVIDTTPETVGGDSPGVTTRGDEGGKRLRNRQVKVTNKKVKVSIQKRPVPSY